MNISKASKISGLSIKTIRYYSDIHLVDPSERKDSGYRIFNEKDIKKLIFVRRAREFGFSISDCRELLDLYKNKKRSSITVKKIASKRLKEILKKQQELQYLNDELTRLISICRGDNSPECPIIDELSN
tara:strand:+ start:78 stop:464 length:387 start_codon:yes stop_codon:yes gene_type:complete